VLPTSADQLTDPHVNQSVDGFRIFIELPKEPVEYPRGMGDWSDAPWVFKKDYTGEPAKMFEEVLPVPGQWIWHSGLGIAGPTGNGLIEIKPFQWSWGDEFVIVFKRVMEGHVPHESNATYCMPWDGWEENTTHNTLGMYSEPDTPYVFAEWDFDLDMDHPMNSTQQFRCVSVYGLTDNHNAADPDQLTSQGLFTIDREVVYQFEEIFNPWDLKQAAELDTFRWAQKGIVPSGAITLGAHSCLLGNHSIWMPEKWGYYCNDSEKVLILNYGSEPILLERDEYTFDPVAGTIDIIANTYNNYQYKILYSTKVVNGTAPTEWHTGQWEWTVLGENSHASDSLGAAMLASGWTDWKNIEVWLSGLDIKSDVIAPHIPVTMVRFSDAFTGRENYHFAHDTDLRAAFRDDWCTPDDWVSATIYPHAISSADLLVVGGPIASEAADYFNDFTDAMIFTEYGDGFYAPGCWARTTQAYYEGMDLQPMTADELWYDNTVAGDGIGHAMVSTYKDLNETVGFIVYGYTAEDTYYTCYALRSGLIPWLQNVQDGTTTLIIEIDYADPDLHPVKFHVKESLGRFTECTGFETSFKDLVYTANFNAAKLAVENEAAELGLCYKLIDIEWCAQLHPDP